ncbi:MAG: thiamine pyrophosphate-dependent enzyme [Steroidobacteraceae bacterium]
MSETPVASRTVGHVVAQELIQLGFGTVFALPGIQNDPLFNAFYDFRDRIRVIHTRHEQAAAYMALGAALATGRPAVCNVVPGPGFLNASAALATAFGLNAPLFFLCGQIPSAEIQLGIGALHEIPDQLGMLRTLTKFADRVNRPQDTLPVLRNAFAAMTSGRPRPVAVEIPMDVLLQPAPRSYPPPRPQAASRGLDEQILDRIAAAVADARRPMIFVGSGAQDSSVHVRALAEFLQAPVVSYRTGRGVMDSRNALSFVLPAARTLWNQSDVVLALGTTLRTPLQRWERRPGQLLFRIDVDPTTHDLLRKPDLALTAHLEEALPRLLRRIEASGSPRPSRSDELLRLRAEWERKVAVLEPQISYLKVIRECLGETGILVEELTQVGFASRLVYPVYRPRTFLSTGYMGTLGWGFPTALGAKRTLPACPVVSITGDGGFMFASSELATAVQHRIALVTVLFNNNQYGNVQQMQRELYGGRIIASDLVNPDFVRFAEAFGARAARVRTPVELREALERGFTAEGPTLIEVPVGDMPSVDRFR